MVREDQVFLTDDRPYQVRGWKVPVLETVRVMRYWQRNKLTSRNNVDTTTLSVGVPANDYRRLLSTTGCLHVRLGIGFLQNGIVGILPPSVLPWCNRRPPERPDSVGPAISTCGDTWISTLELFQPQKNCNFHLTSVPCSGLAQNLVDNTL